MRKFIKCKLVALVTVLLSTMVLSTSVYADDTSLGRTPEGVFPVNEKDVVMESEEITVDLENKSVECTFVFHNTGKSKNVYMGFPGKLNYEDDGPTDAANLELKNFKTFVKGKELPVTHEKSTKNIDGEVSDDLKYSEYFTFTVPFKAGEKVTVRNTYDFIPTNDSMGSVYSGYVLKTGAMWKDTIGSAKVTFKLGKIKPYQIEKLKPGGFKFVGNNIVWERTNFEPNYDLKIEYNTYRYNAENLSNFTDNEEELKQEINKKIDSYTNVKKLVDKGKTDELLALYNKAVEEKDIILAIYISSFLPSDKISNKISDESSTLGDIRIDHISARTYEVSCPVKGPEPANVELNISHFENGYKIVDLQEDISSSFVNLETEVEYTITYTLADWKDHTKQKILKCKINEQGEILIRDGVQVPASVDSSTSAESNSSESAIESVNESSNTTVAETTTDTANESVNESTNEKNNDFRNIVLAVLAVVLVGVLVVAVVIINKNKNKQA